MRLHAFPLAAATAAAALLPACLTDDPDLEEPAPPVVTTGAYHHYAQRAWLLPSTSDEARAMGYDFDRDGRADNQAGDVIAALGRIGLDVATESARAIDDGDVVILHSVRADALGDDASVSWRVLAGAPTSPPRWDGTDVFRAAGEDGTFAGAIRNGTALMDWGVVNLPLPFFAEQAPMVLPLAHARISATITADGCTGRIGGVMLASDIENTLERFVRQAIRHIERNPDHELARVAYQVFDTDDDGTITVAEMAGSAIAETLFRPDVDTDGDGVDDGLSFGLGFTCEAAQFTATGEL
ncbi:MAG: hypothetical protein K8M05_29210 [Deltaproteobacteria bacterium]|nr:hypothetical protein [Kofleriaceae bacterium]